MVGLIESIRIVRLPRSQLHGDEILAISHHWLSNITFVELRDGSILFADLSQGSIFRFVLDFVSFVLSLALSLSHTHTRSAFLVDTKR